MPRRLRAPWIISGTIATGQTSISLTINNNNYERVMVIEQIGVNYSISGDSPQATVFVDGNLYAGPAQLIPINPGLGQSFGGQPYLYAEAYNNVTVEITNGSQGALVTLKIQHREIGYNDSELEGRF